MTFNPKLHSSNRLRFQFGISHFGLPHSESRTSHFEFVPATVGRVAPRAPHFPFRISPFVCFATSWFNSAPSPLGVRRSRRPSAASTRPQHEKYTNRVHGKPKQIHASTRKTRNFFPVGSASVLASFLAPAPRFYPIALCSRLFTRFTSVHTLVYAPVHTAFPAVPTLFTRKFLSGLLFAPALRVRPAFRSASGPRELLEHFASPPFLGPQTRYRTMLYAFTCCFLTGEAARAGPSDFWAVERALFKTCFRR